MVRNRKPLALHEGDALDSFGTAASGPADEAALIDSEMAAEESVMVDDAWEEERPPRKSLRDRLVTAAAILLILGWTGFFVWSRQEALLAPATPEWWSSAIVEWIVPALLVVLVAQLAIRTGRAEQARFADTAAMLSREAAELETRLSVVNRELSLARDFIASQSRDLESLGRVASERLTTSAQSLEGLIAHNSERLETIGGVSDAAVANMEKLRDQLPVLANAARDMTNQIGNTGHTAQQRVAELTAALAQLGEVGEAGESHAEKIRSLVAETLEAFDRQASDIGDSAVTTFENLNRQSDEFRRQLFERDQEALAEIQSRADNLAKFLEGRNERLREIEEQSTSGMRERIAGFVEEGNAMLGTMVEQRNATSADLSQSIKELEKRLVEAVTRVSEIDKAALENARNRLAALAEEAGRLDANVAQSAAAFDAEMARRRETAEAREVEVLANLEDRIAAFDQRMSEREAAHLAKVEGLAEREQHLAAQLARIDDEIGQLGTRFEEGAAGIGAAAATLAERLAVSRDILGENGTTIARLTEESVRLLELIRAGSDHADGDLLEAIGRAESRLASFRTNADTLGELIEQAEGRGAALAAHIETARDHGANTLGTLEQLEGQLGAIAEQSAALAGETRGELQSAIDLLRMTAANVLQDLREGQSEAIREVAGKIAEQSNSAIAEALGEEAAATIAQLEEAAKRAAAAGRDTAVQLRDQLAKVNELTSNLEQRVTVARERAQENIDHDFTRRMALITEALNSSAIDISRAFDNEVADTQWANYLRGDRGIFTRRAVTLLDKQDARAIFDVYEADSEFRETVNRYVHDFEAMLRSVLSTRDGNAIAVTLLSSDIGKLYVALAQAIDRLRD